MDNLILIVDDDPNVLSSLKRILKKEPYEIYTEESGVEGLKILKENKIKLVISDEQMPGMTGTEFLATLKNLFPETVRIMLTGHASIEAAMKAVNSGEIYRFFSKPWNDVELKLSIRSGIEKYDLEAENRRLLKTVKNQAVELKVLEKKHPGISRMKRDEKGNLVLSESSDEEVAKILLECEIEFGKGIK